MRAPFRRDLPENDRTPNVLAHDQPQDRPTSASALGDPYCVVDADDDTEELYLDLGVGD